ncbi:hypothetical protein ACTWP9_13345 [Streptomyces sp. 3N207]
MARLERKVRAAPPRDVEGKLGYLRGCIERGADAYAGYYVQGQLVVRCALVCPRGGERCPDPPR